MNDMKQPEAIRLADALITPYTECNSESAAELRRLSQVETEHRERILRLEAALARANSQAAAELRRLHAENLQLRAALEKQTSGHDKTLDELRISEQDVRRLRSAVHKLHAAKGRYHTQLAACDLYGLLGLKNERPTK